MQTILLDTFGSFVLASSCTRYLWSYENLKNVVINNLKKAGANDDTISNILGNLSVIRTGWGDMFSAIGGKIDPENIADFKQLFGNKFKNYLGSTSSE